MTTLKQETLNLRADVKRLYKRVLEANNTLCGDGMIKGPCISPVNELILIHKRLHRMAEIFDELELQLERKNDDE